MNKIAIVAGDGDLPYEIFKSCHKKKIEALVLRVSKGNNFKLNNEHPVQLEKNNLSKIIAYLQKENFEHVVFAGMVDHQLLFENYSEMKLKNNTLLEKGMISQGDNSYFSGIIHFVEQQGFKVIGVQDILDECIVEKGLLTEISPSDQAQQDIKLGYRIAKRIGEMDIGQAIVIENGFILGVEAIEGTDNLIKRCGDYKSSSKNGLLVKVFKSNQENRIDLPVIGETTIKKLFEANLAGVAIEAGHSIILNKGLVIESANRLGLFIIGL